MGSKIKPGKFDCYAAAEPDEPMFILLARDPLAPSLVSIWAAIRHGDFGGARAMFEVLMSNRGMAYVDAPENDKAREAYQCSFDMASWRATRRPDPLRVGDQPAPRPRSVIEEIASERQRQIDVERFTPDNDGAHGMGQLAGAAACYIMHGLRIANVDLSASAKRFTRDLWPWAEYWWKPKDRRRDLIRAAALVVAEIERIDRVEALKAAAA